MGVRRTLALSLFPFAALLALAAACRDPTQITLDVTTDVPCAELRGTVFRVGRPGELANAPPATVVPSCVDGEGHVGTLVLVPSGDKSENVALSVVSGRGVDPESCIDGAKGCVFARRALRFLPHTPLRLPIKMSAVCAGVPCGADQTCVEGACVSAAVDPSLCVGAGCDEGKLGKADGGLPDAAVVDAESPPPDAAVLDAGGVVAIATGLVNVNQLANDGTGLYFTQDGTGGAGRIARCAKVAGLCTPQTLSLSSNANRIALANGRVFWSDQDGIQSCATPNCPRKTTVVSSVVPSVFLGVAVAGGLVYGMQDGTAPPNSGGAIVTCPQTGPNCSNLVMETSGMPMPYDLTVTGGTAVWTVANQDTTSKAGALRACSLVNCQGTVESMALGLTNPTFLAVDVTIAYISENTNGGRVLAASLAPGSTAATPVATGRVYPGALAVDGGYLYWVEWGIDGQKDGVLARCPLGGCVGAPELLLTGLDLPQGLTIDPTYIYVAVRNAGTILRLPKP